MRILLAEDDTLLGDGIRAGLKLANYAVDWVQDGRLADAALRDYPYDACVLDLGLPGRDGLSVLRALRERGSTMPVLVLTARGTSAEKVTGLDQGADDYLAKPFDLNELHARLRALLRRAAGQASPKLKCGALTLDPATKEVTLRGQPLGLSAREFALLQDLLVHPTHVRTRDQLEQSLYA